MSVSRAWLAAAPVVWLISLLAGACKDPGPVDACGEALPAEGSLCTQEGQECVPDELGCGLYTGVRCDGGIWVFFEVGTGQCTGGSTVGASESGGDETAVPVVPCGEEVPAEGTACESEGEDCAPGEHACAGYIGATCTAGYWKRYEVPPADPEECEATIDCAAVCEATLAAACAAGPADSEACATECEDRQAGECEVAYHEAIACGPEPLTFTCDADDRPTIAGCEDQFDVLYQCSQ